MHIPFGFIPLVVKYNIPGKIWLGFRCALKHIDGILIRESVTGSPSIAHVGRAHAGIADGALQLDAHALALIYSCKTMRLDDYIQGLNPSLRCT